MIDKTKMAVLGLSVGLAALLAPGCVIQIGPTGSGGGNGGGQDATPSGSVGSAGGSETTGGSGGGADAFSGIDPEELDKASLKASALSYNMFGLVNSSGLDPGTVDQAAFDALAEQLAPTAEATVNTWLSTIDPSTIQTSGNQPKWECTEEFKCPYIRKCLNAPYSGITPHNCYVNNCGSAKCSSCPDWFPDKVKKLSLGAWCAYVCTDNSYPANIVAVGVGGVTIFGGPYPEDGAYCFAP